MFFVENVLNVFGSGRSDVRSGTLMTTRCEVKANMVSGNLGNQYWMTKHDSLLIGKIPWPLGALMVNRSVHGSLMREKICELRLHTVTCLATSCGQFILLCRISLVNCLTLLFKCF